VFGFGSSNSATSFAKFQNRLFTPSRQHQGTFTSRAAGHPKKDGYGGRTQAVEPPGRGVATSQMPPRKEGLHLESSMDTRGLHLESSIVASCQGKDDLQIWWEKQGWGQRKGAPRRHPPSWLPRLFRWHTPVVARREERIRGRRHLGFAPAWAAPQER
jgi:hypothetical protein